MGCIKEVSPDRLAAEKKKLRWHCLRGTRELDEILARFMDSGYDQLDPEEKYLFASLLELPNTTLLLWLCYHQTPDNKEMEPLVRKILSAYSP